MNHDYPIVISFYTDNWKYPMYASKMEQDCERLGLDCHIVHVEDTGTWIDNTSLKPQFILDAINELKRSVLWIDVDGMIVKTPDHFKYDYSFDWAARRKKREHQRDWHVSTLYFAYNQKSLAFLEAWVEVSKVTEGSDELALDILWKEQGKAVCDAKGDELPLEYFQMLNSSHPDPLRHTVIAHRSSKGESKVAFIANMKRSG